MSREGIGRSAMSSKDSVMSRPGPGDSGAPISDPMPSPVICGDTMTRPFLLAAKSVRKPTTSMLRADIAISRPRGGIGPGIDDANIGEGDLIEVHVRVAVLV